MDEDRDELIQGNSRNGIGGDPVIKAVLQALNSSEVRISQRTREFMALILLIGIFIVACVLWSGRTEVGLTTTLPATSPDVRTGDRNIESTPEVKYATSGEWLETSGMWSRFGVLGGAYDGEQIVMSSAESTFGSLGCRISPRGRPMNGTCYEVANASISKLPAERSCLWQVVIVEISATSVRGKRLLKREESDAGCAADYKPVPSPFVLERPRGQQTLAVR